MTVYEALKLIREEDSAMIEIRRSFWRRMQESWVVLRPSGVTAEAWMENIVNPLARAVARGMITEDQAMGLMYTQVREENEAKFAHWSG